MRLVNIDPIMVEQIDGGITYTIVLNPVFDKELLEYIRDNNVEIGEYI